MARHRSAKHKVTECDRPRPNPQKPHTLASYPISKTCGPSWHSCSPRRDNRQRAMRQSSGHGCHAETGCHGAQGKIKGILDLIEQDLWLYKNTDPMSLKVKSAHKYFFGGLNVFFSLAPLVLVLLSPLLFKSKTVLSVTEQTNVKALPVPFSHLRINKVTN